MPGLVAKLLVSEGEPVERGQTLLILEAMKMEIKIAAPHAGRVIKVLIRQGQVVDRGQGLIEISNDQ
jgi:biotin carboxyl carrier protein